MRYLSTFSGIGGFELGIQLAYETIRDSDVQAKRGRQAIKEGELQDYGQRLHTISSKTTLLTTDRNNEHVNWGFNKGQLTCIGYSEIDKYASSIYQKHFPTHHNYGDITKIVAEDLPDFDLLVGGFPCQAFSIAGKRGGFEDTRGTMFFELARILRAKQPRLFVFENVKGLLSHDNGRTFATIIATLDGLGYDLQWQVLNSKNHGVPQNRERVFIIGHLRGTSRPEVFPFISTDTEAHRARITSTTIDANYSKGIDNHGARTGISQLNQPTHSNDRVYGTDGISPTLNTMQGGNRQPFIRITEDGFHLARQDAKKSSIQGTHVTFPEGKAHCLNTNHKPQTLTSEMKIRRLTPTECERLQGFPDGWTEGVSDTQRYKTLGNAVTVNVIKDLFTHII